MSDNTKQRIGIIGSVGIPASYGGFETLAHELTASLQNAFDFTVYCSGTHYQKDQRVEQCNGARLQYIPLPANGLLSILYDLWSMLMAIRQVDILLVLGVSGCIFLPMIKLLSSKPVIVNLDGIEWRRDKWGSFARWFLKVSEKMAIRWADKLISDNEGIRNEIIMRYKRDSETIAYGGNQAFSVKSSRQSQKKYPFLSGFYAFKVCRIEPENNVEMILEAFALHRQTTLVIVGNWQRSEWAKGLYERYRLFPNIHLFNPIYDQKELNLLRSNASLYIHGHQAGGTNPSLVEAMSLGLPVFAFDVVFNKETTKYKARYFEGVYSLRLLMETISTRELHQLGNQMQSIAKQAYTWEAIGQKYASLFHSVCEYPVSIATA